MSHDNNVELLDIKDKEREREMFSMHCISNYIINKCLLLLSQDATFALWGISFAHLSQKDNT